MKTCIIAVAKCENLYVDEWVNYHLNLGFDRIFICDNNDSGGEKISDIINDEQVTILDYHDIKSVQTKAYTEVFLNHKDEYDWLAFIDIDEFIVLEDKYNDIKQFLSDSIFENADIVRLSWKILTSKSTLDVVDGNYNVISRFKDVYKSQCDNMVKSIIRGNIEYVGDKFYGHGYFKNQSLNAVNAEGKKCENTWVWVREGPIYKNAWVNHYPTKTIGEYIRQKFFRGGSNNNIGRYLNFDYFFMFNEYDEEKENYGKQVLKEMVKTEKYRILFDKFVKNPKRREGIID